MIYNNVETVRTHQRDTNLSKPADMNTPNESQPGRTDQVDASLLPPPPPSNSPASPVGPFKITLWDGRTELRFSASHLYTIGVPIIAILCCYLGVAQVFETNSTPESEALQQEHYKDSNIDEVSKFWGKGEFLSWLLTVNALHLDILLDRRSWLQVPRWLAVLAYSISALAVQIKLALQCNFGPHYDAVRYVTDKGLQALVIVYFLAFAKTHLHTIRPEGPPPPVTQQNRPPKYKLWPFIVLACFWLVPRCLAYGKVIYSAPRSFVEDSRLWRPPIPAEYAPLVAVGGFLSTILCLYPFAPGTPYQKIVSGLPAGVWFGFVLNHIGLHNSPRALALASSEWKDLGTIVPLALTGLTVIYGLVDPDGESPLAVWLKGCCSAIVAVQQTALSPIPAGEDGSYELREAVARAEEAGGVDARELTQEQALHPDTPGRHGRHELQETHLRPSEVEGGNTNELQETGPRASEADGSELNELQGGTIHPIEADGAALYELASDSSSICSN
jgi:hypothetical protein